MNDNINKLFSEEKTRYDQQRLKQRKILRIIGLCLMPLFWGIGFISIVSLFKTLSRQQFINVSATVIVYSLLSGLVEYIKTKTKDQKKILFFLIQLALFGLMSLITIRIIEN
ncbi:Uncharacterised protein [uncultured archaeon]|nr:Uncharacterised protein [uncultured archaeon]